MTKTYRDKHGTMTVTDTTTPLCAPGVLLTCDCATHKGNSGRAVLTYPDGAAKFPKGRVHGYVTMAHDPTAGVLATKMGKVWKA
jgi:hypothetical protein